MAMHQSHQQQPPSIPSGVGGHSLYQGGGQQLGKPLNADVRHPAEKDIQFLQNVHFPERLMQPPPPPQSLMPTTHPQISHHIAAGGLNNLQTSDFGHLLPPNMSFYEMSIEPKEFQLKWFFKLMETHGLEMAHKFAEILRQVPTPCSAGGKMTPSLVVKEAQQPAINPLAGLNSQVDLAFDSLMSGSSIPQPIMRELFGGTAAALQTSAAATPQMVPFNSSGSSGRSSDVLGDFTPSPMSSQQSVPLYRRQASQHYSSSASSNAQSVTSSTPDLMENHHSSLFDSGTSLNSTSSMYHGNFMSNLDPFATGLPSIQTLAAGLQPHIFQTAQQPQQPQDVSNPTILQRQQNTTATGATYASVLTQGAANSHHPPQHPMGSKQNIHGDDDKDPFAAIRELGQRSNGYYNYFQ